MQGLNNLLWSGLFVNDLSMHDYSRDIMLANAQTVLWPLRTVPGAPY
jgi:hypothetical protein